MAIHQLEHTAPEVHSTAWVAETAVVVGKVTLGENAGIWYGAVLRGDNDRITVGANSNVQDGSVLHTDHGMPLTIGANVTVGHQVTLHGCTIGDGSLIGIGAIVLNGAKIGKRCIVGAGALVTERSTFPDGMLILGTPAKAVRPLTPEQIARLQMSADYYVQQQQRHRRGLKRVD